MGRRALPKIDRTVDFSFYHRFLDEVPCPFDSGEFFGRQAPFEVEIGSGKGLFLINSSRANPDRDYLGIEAAKKYARFAAYRMAKAECANARMISGDGIRFLKEFLSNESVDAVHVYFPDPWWKERHRRRRVMQTDSILDMQRVLKPGGELHFWTDVEEYFEATVELVQKETDFRGPFEVPEQPAENEMDFRTHFERRMRLNDHPVFRSRFQKPT